MTDTLATPETEQPEPKPHRWLWALGASVAVVGVTAAVVGLGHVTPEPTTATPGICGSWLTVRPTTFNGVALDVNIPGPDTITVDLWGSFDEHRRLFQQVTRNSPGANFMAWDFSYKITAIEVTIKNGAHCSVDTNIIDQVNTANGHN